LIFCNAHKERIECIGDDKKFCGCINRYINLQGEEQIIDRAYSCVLGDYLIDPLICCDKYILCANIRNIKAGDRVFWIGQNELYPYQYHTCEFFKSYNEYFRPLTNLPANNLYRVSEVINLVETSCEGSRTGQIYLKAPFAGLESPLTYEDGYPSSRIGEIYKIQRVDKANFATSEFYFIPISTSTPALQFFKEEGYDSSPYSQYIPIHFPTAISLFLGAGIRDIAGNSLYDGDDSDNDNDVIVHIPMSIQDLKER
jgi:hypothetical protein